MIVNRNNICPIIILDNRNTIHEMKWWHIGIGIYLLPKYQQIDLGQIYLQTICKLFTNRELFAEHCSLYRTAMNTKFYTVLYTTYTILTGCCPLAPVPFPEAPPCPATL